MARVIRKGKLGGLKAMEIAAEARRRVDVKEASKPTACGNGISPLLLSGVGVLCEGRRL